MQLIVLASGSKANALLLREGDTRILVDVGLGIRGLLQALQMAEEYPQNINAIFLTHEHTDHTRGLDRLLSKVQIPVYASAGTLSAISPGFMRRQKAFPMNGSAVDVGPFTVRAHGISHDAAEPMAYQIHCGSETVTVATDLGEVPPDLQAAFSESTIAVIESNHDEELLRTGSYPEILKRRIASNTGHLSNRQTADALRECRNKNLKHVVLAHLSEENNHPDLARDSARTALDNPEIAVHLTAQKTFGPLLTLP
ncbi:MAG: MBL fold metallo-hydrolase [Calditrichaeota bacterium]|nr:MBL fold metallo-hydrolase [Calditrichota bacterium]